MIEDPTAPIAAAEPAGLFPEPTNTNQERETMPTVTVSSNRTIYDLPAAAAIGDSFTAEEQGNRFTVKVIGYRRRGSFSGQGYDEFKLRTIDDFEYTGFTAR